MSSTTEISKTALDALMAKMSAVSAGYDPDKNNTDRICYGQLLTRVMDAVSSMHPRRQTPLVNAGYAARVAVMTHMIQQFLISMHDQSDVNVVLLGCGMDVLGVWSLFLPSDQKNVHVYELDRADICRTKRDALIQSGLLTLYPPTKRDTDTDACGSIVAQGYISTRPGNAHGGEDVTSHPPPNYTLLSVDLRNAKAVQELGLESKTFSRPTLTISELVLAYLPRSNTTELLQQVISSEWCRAPGSVFCCYEPIGTYKKSNNDNYTLASASPIVYGYTQHYVQQFHDKLHRGRQSQQQPQQHKLKQRDEIVMEPIGADCASVEQWLLTECGFHRASCRLAGTVAANTNTISRLMGQPVTEEPGEWMDEHAALALHLRSYAVAVAFSESTPAQMMEERMMGPIWSCRRRHTSINISTSPNSSQLTLDIHNTELLLRNEEQETNLVTISPILMEDQESVRTLFQNTYTHLFEQYPAVRKMVKTALRTDLSGKTNDLTKGLATELKPNENSKAIDKEQMSSIGMRYEEGGGFFLVASIDGRSNDDDENNALNDLKGRTIIGCIGIRLNPAPMRATKSIQMYEIQRLAVDPTFRGHGIGKTLLKAAVGNLSKHHCHGLELVATTPVALESANYFYIHCGFYLQKETTMGKMVMRTYTRRLS